MHFHAAPSVAAECPGFSRFSQEQLDQLARSVELRRQQLEHDINAYIQRKQAELRQYEIELVEQHRSMERDADPGAAERSSAEEAAGRSKDMIARSSEDMPARPSPTPSPPTQTPPPTQPPPEEKKQKKQKKHGRVHKRERELYGLVTPVFLPLLDAHESTAPSKEEKKPATPTPTPTHASTAPSAAQPGDAERSAAGRTSQNSTTDAASDMAGPPRAKERPAPDAAKQSRRSSIKKKSALRHTSTPQARKRVSLVIDDRVVRPSDTIQAEAHSSSSSAAPSAPTSPAASLDDAIDPRLGDAPVYIEHTDAEHHSLPLASAPKTPKTHLPDAPPRGEVELDPPDSTPPKLPLDPPSYAPRSFLDPPLERQHMADLPPGPSGPPCVPALDQHDQRHLMEEEGGFSTYVGGLSGSGVDDVNQAGSVGYPSSLGASYLESYMSTRPLSVRMAAAEGEGRNRERREPREEEWGREAGRSDVGIDVDKEDWARGEMGNGDDEMEAFMGGMDGL